MKKDEIISNVKDCFKNAHKFSSYLGESKSINRDYLVENLKNVSATEIHIALLEMHENKEIEYDTNSGLILISLSTKPDSLDF
ncbi:MAG: hypothetical protein PHC28_02505 [Flavobacterium sp.]|uniref:hypothetical protein n=1 Tax=Flavobacterium sp. TaxID=239 RepID=UPI002615B089|nr:hypothetical protein [Flavobacterium sp.]MDD5149338.1 hypothetical protein [Flavobacterium sp.]